MARAYKRDSRGRFAGGGGGSRSSRPSGPASPAKGRTKGSKPAKARGSLPARRKVAAAKGKLAAMDAADNSIKGALSRRAQKGAVTRAKKKLAAARKAGTVKMKKLGVAFKKGRGGKGLNNPGLDLASVQKRLARASAGVKSKKRSKAQSDKSASTRRRAAVIYKGQESLAKTGDLTREIVKRGTRKMAEQAAARAATAKDRKASRLRARMDNEAFAARMKRATSVPIRRFINESDRNNALTSEQRRAADVRKRNAAASSREARSERTASRARQFYYNYGSASAFGRRERQSTSSSPNFGSKRRRRKR